MPSMLCFSFYFFLLWYYCLCFDKVKTDGKFAFNPFFKEMTKVLNCMGEGIILDFLEKILHRGFNHRNSVT